MSSKHGMAVAAAVLCCLPALSFGAPSNSQNQVFGNRGLASQANTAPRTQADRPESGQRVWQRDQEFALGMYHRVIGGDAAAATDLKNAANQGNKVFNHVQGILVILTLVICYPTNLAMGSSTA